MGRKGWCAVLKAARQREVAGVEAIEPVERTALPKEGANMASREGGGVGGDAVGDVHAAQGR